MADTLKKYGDALKSIPPGESEVAGLKAAQQNVDDATAKPTATPVQKEVPNLLHPLAKYGDRPGEQRLDAEGNVIPSPKAIPSYGEGTTYVPEDQVAKVHEGEAVLPPEEAAQYRAEHEQAPAEETKPAPAEAEAPKAKSFGELVDAKATEKADATAAAQPQAAPAPMPEEKPKMTYGHVLADKWMQKNGMAVPKEFNQGAPDQGAMEQGASMPKEATPAPQPAARMTPMNMPPADKPALATYGGPGKPVAPGEAIPAKQLKQDEYKYRLADKEKQYQQAREAFGKSGDPRDQLRTDAMRRDIMEYKSENPWGSAGNHPGILGKIAHYGSAIGNIAGNVVAPGVMMNIPGTELNKKAQAQGVEKRIEKEVPEVTAREAEENKPENTKPLTNPEATYKDLMTGGPNGGPKPNPDTQQPFTAQEANVASQGTGKTPEELYIQEGMKGIDPATGKHYTRAQQEERYLQMKAGTKPANEEEKRVNDYIASRGQEATPANREAARTALKASDTVATQQAALPFAEQKAKFNDNLSTTRALLVQQNADANQRGLKSDELQNTENVRSAGVSAKLTTAKDALNAPDDQFANQIAPVVSLLAVTSAEGVKRVNKQELDKFVPTSGSFGRWIEAHADQFLSGQIPADYRMEVGHMLDRMQAAEDVEHKINTGSIDNTVRQGAQQPVQKPTGGAEAKPAPSKPVAAPAGPPKGSTGIAPGSDGKMYYHDAQGKPLGIAPAPTK
jgi:hypothetical protein